MLWLNTRLRDIGLFVLVVVLGAKQWISKNRNRIARYVAAFFIGFVVALFFGNWDVVHDTLYGPCLEQCVSYREPLSLQLLGE